MRGMAEGLVHRGTNFRHSTTVAGTYYLNYSSRPIESSDVNPTLESENDKSSAQYCVKFVILSCVVYTGQVITFWLYF